MDGFIELTQEKLKTDEGIRELNRMIEILFRHSSSILPIVNAFSITGSVEQGCVVYISGSGQVGLANAADNTKPAIAICVEVDTVAKIQQIGSISVKTVGDGDIAAGDKVFLSTTAGKITKTFATAAGNIIQLIGIAKEAESGGMVEIVLGIDFNPVRL